MRDGPVRFLWSEGSLVAYERGEGAARFVVAVNAGDEPARAEVWLGDGARLEPVEVPGFIGVSGGAIVDGRIELDLPGRSGGILRIA